MVAASSPLGPNATRSTAFARASRIHSWFIIGRWAALSCATDREKCCSAGLPSAAVKWKGSSMSVTSPPVRPSRLAIVTLTGAAGCRSPRAAHPTTQSPLRRIRPAPPPSSSPSASAKGKDWVNGLIDSVSGNDYSGEPRSGTATIDFTPSTAVSELTAAQLTDITAGSCIRCIRTATAPQHTAAQSPLDRCASAPLSTAKCPSPTSRRARRTPPVSDSGQVAIRGGQHRSHD